MNKAKWSKDLPKQIPLVLLTIFTIAPLVILFFNSLKSRYNIGQDPVGFPKQVLFSNYGKAWERSEFANHMLNSSILVVFTVFCVLTLGGLAAYALARIEPKGSGAVMFYLLVVSALPIWLYMVPLFFLWRTFGLLNSFLGLVIIYTAVNSPFAIFLLRSYLLKVPKEIEESATIDGASRWQIMMRIILPITWTGFLTVGLVVAVGVWGEFQIALTMIQDENKMPITTSFFSFADKFGSDWTLTSAVGIMAIIPILALFLIFQRQFTEGLTQGSVKG
jgi:raffinose/stachyose/melibiose transport system permease protein